MHLLLVNDFLLKYGQVNHLVSLIIQQSNIYRRNNQFHRCLQLRLHAYQLTIQKKNNYWCNPRSHKKRLDGIVSVLFNILDEENTVPVKSLALLWEWVLCTTDNVFTVLLFQFISITTYVSKCSLEPTVTDRKDQINRNFLCFFRLEIVQLLVKF